jgi:hypothetical protein
MPLHLAAEVSGVAEARTAERGLFDFVLVGGDSPLTALAALSGGTERIGLVAAVDTAGAHPFELSRQWATLEHLSGGRAGWCVPEDDEFVAVAEGFWDSWLPDAVLADVETGVYADPARIRAVEFTGTRYRAHGLATLPGGQPVLFGAGDDTLTAREGRQRRVFRRVSVDGFDPRVRDGGFLLTGDLEAFVDSVVPLLQQRGDLRSAYPGATLREHLGFSAEAGPDRRVP